MKASPSTTNPGRKKQSATQPPERRNQPNARTTEYAPQPIRTAQKEKRPPIHKEAAQPYKRQPQTEPKQDTKKVNVETAETKRPLSQDVNTAVNELLHEDFKTLGLNIKQTTDNGVPADSVQAFVPYESVTQHGTIITRDKSYLRIMEIGPTNFLLCEASEQDVIVSIFSAIYKTGPKKIRLKTIVMPANKERYVSEMRERAKESDHEGFKALVESHCDHCESLSAQALERRFFLIFEYEKTHGIINPSMYDIEASLDRTENSITATLHSCGNSVLTIDNIREGEDRRIATLDILYLFYNKRMYAYDSLRERTGRIITDYMESKGLDPDRDDMPALPISYYIAPRGLDLTHNDCAIMSGRYYNVLYMTSRGYPLNVYAGWPSIIINAGEGVELDMQFERIDDQDVLTRVNRNMNFTSARLSNTSQQANDYEIMAGAYSSGQYIKDCLMQGENLHQMTTLITVSAMSQKALSAKTDEVKKMLRAVNFEARECKWDIEDAIKSITPGLYIGKDIERKAHRNVMTMGAAATYPLSSFEMSDNGGVMIGINAHNNTPCLFNPYSTKDYPNANILILGTTGSGKSYCMQTLAMHFREKGNQVFVLLPEKGMEFQRICNAIGGEFVHISGSSPTHLNIMDIRPVDNGDEAYLAGADCALENDSWLLSKIEKINTFMSMIIDNYDDEYEYITDTVTMQTYERYGITEDNESVYTDSTHKEIKLMPILSDLKESYRMYADSDSKDITDNERMKARACEKKLHRYTDGPLKSLNARTNVDLSNQYIVFDFTAMRNERAIGLFIVLDYLWGKIREDRTKFKMCFIDELWMFLSSQGEGGKNKEVEKAQAALVSDFVMRLAKLVRGYAGSLVTATQNIHDLFGLNDGAFGASIINNCKTKIILDIENSEREDMMHRLNLTESEMRAIQTGGRGNGLLLANTKKINIKIMASDYEHDLITTDPNELRKQTEKERAEKMGQAG